MKPLLLLGIFFAVSSPASDTVYYNGVIYTGDSGNRIANWMQVRDGKVVAVGPGKLLPKVDPATLVDLEGDVLLPGLTDAHAHLSNRGEELSQIDLRGTKTAQEAAERVRAALAADPTGKDPLVGNAWDQSEWPEQKFSDRKVLDAVSATRPIVLYRVDGHAAWVNTVALKKSGIWRKKSDPQGGKIERDAKGEPTGILVDTAMRELSKLSPKPTVAKYEKYIEAAVREALKLGITSVHDAGIGANELEAIRRLLASGRVKFRFYEMVSGSPAKELRSFLKKGIVVGSYDDQLTVRTVKLFQDGAMGSRGAAFHSAYADDEHNHGLLRMPVKELTALVGEIDKAGFQIATHAIGTLANETAIDAYERVMGKEIGSKRPRLEHAQVLTEKDIARVGKLGIVASMQPTHCTSDMKWVEARIGKERARFAYAWKALLNANAPLAFGSDSPVESINPWQGLFAAVTRQTRDLQPKDGFFPEQRLTREEAFVAFTRGAAYAGFAEKTSGSLEAGKRADFVQLKKDPFKVSLEELYEMPVKATYVGGEKVYSAPSEVVGE